MALPNVYIELIRNGLGLVVETNDNTCGIIVPGTAVNGKLELNKPYDIYSTDGAKAIGIDPDGVNSAAYRHISEFYSVAGTGKKLWVLAAQATSKLSDLVNPDAGVCPAKVLLNEAKGEIVALGLTAKADSGTTLDGLDNEVYKAMTSVQVLANEYQKKIMPFVALIEGRKFTGNASQLRSLYEEDRYRCSVPLFSTSTDGSASVGLMLGQIAALPVQRKISRVKNGALPIDVAYLSDGKAVKGREDLDTIHDKRFVILRQFPNKSGYFFNGDFTATSQTDDLNTIARIRTIDKATKIAYNTYVDELDDDVETNSDGTIHRAVAADLKEKIEKQVNNAMSGEISKFTATVDTSIDILSGNDQVIYLDITPKGYLTNIRVVLGFKNE
ncbi:DUF2586 family protein [Dysgonomonas sp. 520]|uniref:DUF2586 family protein n=1 Tax=Dysgonomonas sp. 520 TaxID=2302931 RepID=UPI0013D043A5|nr:DUF2586 family protein [Dysgonomonas sp. 520]NDW10452.1 hypothetical protein [Dysgonomonas sp. 520]